MLKRTVLLVSSLVITSASSNFLPESYRDRLVELLVGTEVESLIREELPMGHDLVQLRDAFLKSIEWLDLASSEEVARVISSERHLLASLTAKRNPFSRFSDDIKVGIKKYIASMYEDCFKGRVPSAYTGPTVTVRDLQIRKTSDFANQMRSTVPDLEILGIVPNEGFEGFGWSYFRGGTLVRSFLGEFVDIERRCSLRFTENKTSVDFFPENRTLVVQDLDEETFEFIRNRKYLFTVYVGDHPGRTFYADRFAHFWIGPDGNLRSRSDDYRANGSNLGYIFNGQRYGIHLPPKDTYLRVFSDSGDLIDTILLEEEIHDQVLFENGYTFYRSSEDFDKYLKGKFPEFIAQYDSDKFRLIGPEVDNPVILVSGKKWIQRPFSEKYPNDLPTFSHETDWVSWSPLVEAAEAIFHPQELAVLAESGGIYMSSTKSVYVSRYNAAKLQYLSDIVQVFVDSDRLDEIWQEDGLLGKITLKEFTERSQISRIEVVAQMLRGKPEGLKEFLNHVLKDYNMHPWTVFNDREKAFQMIHLDGRKARGLRAIADVTDIDTLERLLEATSA